jgi:hypothetical protein
MALPHTNAARTLTINERVIDFSHTDSGLSEPHVTRESEKIRALLLTNRDGSLIYNTVQNIT